MILVSSLLISYAIYTSASPILISISPRQAVTALIFPPQPPPPGCTGSFPSVFGIAVMNISLSATSPNPSQTQTIRRRQDPPAPVLPVGMLNQINDGQVQGGMHTDSVSVVEYTRTSASVTMTTMMPVTQIGDGQVQGPGGSDGAEGQGAAAMATATMCSSSASDLSMPSSFPPSVAITSDLSSTSTSSAQACGSSTRLRLSSSTAYSFPVQAGTAISSGLPASNSTATTSISTPTTSPASAPSPFVSPSTQPLSLVSCLTNSTLQLRLQNNTLSDALNRTGYIASNYQFQFDGPPQSGAIYTTGWSSCPVDTETTNSTAAAAAAAAGRDGGTNGIMTLALGGSTMFWQCLSGSFYNLYTENWAAQCSPVELRIVRFVECGQ